MYPSNQQYKESVANGFYFKNGEFHQHFFEAIKNSNGELVYETGQNATVFKVKDSDGNQKALKLFFREDKERSYRYKEIGEYLTKLNSSYFIGFEYSEGLIYVDGVNGEHDNYFPAVIMDWVDGKTLEGKIKELTAINDIRALRKLASNFLKLSQFLLSEKFAHGDLKHDNIIVDDNLELKVIDYDGLYVPNLKGETSYELGTKSFQHPIRNKSDFNENIDDFSILSIYVTLITFAKYPNYYKRFSDQQNLFFREEDFLNPQDSEIFKLLNLDIELKPYVTSILVSLAKNNIYINGLESILKGKFPLPKLTKKLSSNFDFYLDQKKEIMLETKNCDEVSVLLDDIEFHEFDFDIYVSRLLISLPNDNVKKLTFILKNDYGEKKLYTNINIKPSSQVIQFKSNESYYKEGDEVVVTYAIKYVKSAEIREIHDPTFSIILDEDQGKVRFKIVNSGKYYLKITDFFDKEILSDPIFLEIIYPVEICSFSSNYQHIFEGIPVDLSWQVKHAEKLILINDRFEKEDVTGLQGISVTPVKNVSYTLECSNKYYKQTTFQKVNIYVQPNPHKLSLSNLTPNLKDLNLDFEIDKIKWDDLNVNLPTLDIDLNLEVNLNKEGEFEIQSLNKKSIKEQLYNLLKFKK